MWTSKFEINQKNLPKKSQQRFYNFGMLSVFPRVLKAWREVKGQEKYFWDKPGFYNWYIFKINYAWENRDLISVIIFAILALYQKEKLK